MSQAPAVYEETVFFNASLSERGTFFAATEKFFREANRAALGLNVQKRHD